MLTFFMNVFHMECGKVIKVRNEAFRILKGSLSFENLMEYKRRQEKVRQVMKNRKVGILQEILEFNRETQRQVRSGG